MRAMDFRCQLEPLEVSDDRENVGKLSSHIDLRLDMLPVAWDDADAATTAFIDAIRLAGGDLSTSTPSNHTKPFHGVVGPVETGYRAALAICTAISETHTSIEQIEHLIRAVYRWNKWAKPNSVADTLKQIAGVVDADGSWYTLFDSARNHYLHQHAAFPVIDWTSGEPDVLLLKQDIDDFSDPYTYLQYSEIRAAYAGFVGSLEDIEIFLMRCLVGDDATPLLLRLSIPEAAAELVRQQSSRASKDERHG